jgi:hypothetical protein
MQRALVGSPLFRGKRLTRIRALPLTHLLARLTKTLPLDRIAILITTPDVEVHKKTPTTTFSLAELSPKNYEVFLVRR